MNTEQHFKARIIMFICGIAAMTFGIALSCKANLGTSPISSVPWVLSLCTPFSVGFLTIAMNLLFVAVQPLLLRDYNPDTLLERWIACLASVVILAFGVFLEVRAKIFLAAGEGLVNVLAFVSHKSFSLIKNCFDISLVTLAVIIAFMEFGGLHGVGLGTVAAAVLAGRIIYLYETYLHFFDKWKVKA